MHTITKGLEICIDINIEISEVDHYTWILTSRTFTLALEITFLLNDHIFIQMAYELLSQSGKLLKRGGGGGRVVLIRASELENFLKKIKRGGGHVLGTRECLSLPLYLRYKGV